MCLQIPKKHCCMLRKRGKNEIQNKQKEEFSFNRIFSSLYRKINKNSAKIHKQKIKFIREIYRKKSDLEQRTRRKSLALEARARFMCVSVAKKRETSFGNDFILTLVVNVNAQNIYKRAC
jgi:hypothetical protein